MTSISIAAYLTLFAGVAIAFLLVALLLGRFFRPHEPNATKLETYECGEPAVGSSYVQFDLRFYVVALVFIIFEVEVAFFFPWATVFGKSVQATARAASPDSVKATCEEFGLSTAAAEAIAKEPDTWPAIFRSLALASMADIAVFFGVLLVGFAYLWRQGDLNWVRAVWAPATDDGEGRQGGNP